MIALGRHIIAELYNCDVGKINDVTFVEKAMLQAADRAGATVINSTFHHFSPFGVSGVIVIQESHFSIHCWPEHSYASIDIYTCGDTVDPWEAYKHLKTSLNATHGSTMELNRGQSSLISDIAPSKELNQRMATVGKGNIKSTRNIWFTERNDNIALSLKHSGERLYLHQSPYQKIEIFDTEALGKILVLNGNIACAEEDEYVYHEMIAHVPLFAHKNAERILVVGGGDGGTVRELLRHRYVKRIDLVEIDEFVIRASKAYLPDLALSLEDPKVSVHIEDGVSYVHSCDSEKYDIVIVDSDNPDGISKGLFSVAFYKEIYRILKPDGIMITQSESPRFNQEIFREVFACYNEIYSRSNVFCYLMYLPSFPSGMWSFSFSSKGGDSPFTNLDEPRITQFCANEKLRYYSYDVHNSSFVLPKFVQDILE